MMYLWNSFQALVPLLLGAGSLAAFIAYAAYVAEYLTIPMPLFLSPA
jgi:hypothetical protein